jgi:hypothetical protein
VAVSLSFAVTDAAVPLLDRFLAGADFRGAGLVLDFGVAGLDAGAAFGAVARAGAAGAFARAGAAAAFRAGRFATPVLADAFFACADFAPRVLPWPVVLVAITTASLVFSGFVARQTSKPRLADQRVRSLPRPIRLLFRHNPIQSRGDPTELSEIREAAFHGLEAFHWCRRLHRAPSLDRGGFDHA